ncbi:MAG: hypothetical protein K8T89_23520 [Planctomycetes bacterium]|nr:hypothetical protein [Planctomycetota bacterium]
MARKLSTATPSKSEQTRLRAEIKRALSVLDIGGAVGFARRLLASEPSEASQRELQRVYLECIRILFERKSLTEANRLINEAESLKDTTADWLENLAICFAQLGEGERARLLLARLPASPVLAKVQVLLIDQAMTDFQRGRDRVPPEFVSGFNLIRQAFADYDRGQDETARTALQGIGLQSPFLEWKLLIRGLIAYSTNDDARAIDNWQRLDPERLPAKLAAPLRFSIDPAWKATLPVEQMRLMSSQAEKAGSPILQALRDMQRPLGTSRDLSQILRKHATAIEMLKRQYPPQFTKLANIFYWQIQRGGQPQDIDAYERAFGPPVDDPRFDRLKANVMEAMHSFEEANHFWKNYADWIEKNPQRWPGEQGKRARARLYLRMGDNAIEILEGPNSSMFDEMAFLLSRGKVGKTKQPSPELSPEKYFQKAAELSPNWKEPALRLLEILGDEERWEDAEAVGKRAIEHNPDDVDLLVRISVSQGALGKLDEAMKSLKKAVQSNPLDKKLRMAYANLVLQNARAIALANQFDEARIAFQEAISFDSGTILGQNALIAWSACEEKAGNNDKVRELEERIGQVSRTKSAIIYMSCVEYTRIKVKKAILQPRQSRFEELLASDLSTEDLMALIKVLAYYQLDIPRYRGIGPHEKKITAQLQKLIKSNPSERQLVDLGMMVWSLRLPKILKICVDAALSRFPKNPCFSFLAAEQMIQQRPKSFSERNVYSYFQKAMRGIEDLTDDTSRTIRDAIEARWKEYPELEPMDDDDEFGFDFFDD